MDVTRETTRRLEASCRLMLYADAVRGVWLARKEERKGEGSHGRGYVIGELTSIAKGHILIPLADTGLF